VKPVTQYAKSGGVHIAFQVVGDGPLDLVFVPGWLSHLELAWEEPLQARFLRRLASFSRLILLDKRGTGLSDRVPDGELPTLEVRIDDVRAVMDAAGSQRAALFGYSEGGAMSALFAATHPSRTSALVLYGSHANWLRDRDNDWAPTRQQHEEVIRAYEQRWGSAVGLGVFAPSVAKDDDYRRRFGTYLRMAASPGAAAALLRMNIEVDIRPILAAVLVPTLVVHRRGDRTIPAEAGRYLAAHIPGARLAELDGVDHFPWIGDSDAIVDEVEQFLTGSRRVFEPDRALLTVLFSDIVASTERAAALGDQRWGELLAAHQADSERQIGRFSGRAVKWLGDGVLATFDGPARAIRCALALVEEARRLDVEVRVGIHAGECEISEGDVGGLAVHIGARVMAQAGPGEVIVSRTVKDLVVGSGFSFADRGDHELKGVPGDWRLFSVE
jgi:pimeloyl-ACP methyl ester carboxylesterase/class 3 adenylate cyclase